VWRAFAGCRAAADPNRPMLRILSSYLFINRKLTPEMLGEIARSGVGAVELFCSRHHFDYRSDDTVADVAAVLRDSNLALHALHAPTERDTGPARHSGVPLSISDPERGRRIEALDEIRRVLDLAEQLPFRILVLHLGSSRDEADPRRYDAAFSSLERLRLFAKQSGVTIALENTPSHLASPANLRQFISDTRLSDLRLCFDVGHAHLGDGVMPSFQIMRDLVVTAHMHDNHGFKDEHLPPFSGDVEWDAALPALTGVQSPLVLELKEQPAYADPAPPSVAIEAARAAFDRLESALDSAASRGA
jgi:sugar phosphate isomerase/epimerase